MTNTNVDSARALSSSQIYQCQTEEKKSEDDSRVTNIEQGTFTPLVYSMNGGLGNECQPKHLVNKTVTKTSDKYEKVLTWIRCRLSFIVVKAVVLCLRGSYCVNKQTEDFALACTKAGICT